MATKPTKTSTVKAKKPSNTSAPKVSRARKSDAPADGSAQELHAGERATPSAATAATPAAAAATPAAAAATPAAAAIAQRAYERFAARGHQHGQDVEDWLTAERELTLRQ